jgi:energy-coupling factor transport system ATP-binding protein
MIEFDAVSFWYPDADEPVLDGVDLAVPEGELSLVIGASGSGKSTLLRAVNGLVPRFSGGHLAGSVTVAGRSTVEFPPRELADVVGSVGQVPANGFVTDTVEDELAYVMENLGVAPQVMRRRIEDVVDLLGLHDLRQRPLATLSGGQQQRVAIGSVLTASPQVLVLDEPTSALDPAAAEDVLAALARMVDDLGLTVLLAEHRLERVVQFADAVTVIGGPGTPVTHGLPAAVMADAPVAPPVVHLARLAGWSPMPLSIRDARRAAAPLRDRLSASADLLVPGRVTGGASDARDIRDTRVTVRNLSHAFGPVSALRSVDLDLDAGAVTALMGRNGSGKSTLLSLVAGLMAPGRGRLDVGGVVTATLAPAEARKRVGLVPQDPSLLLWHDRVDVELTAADAETGASPGSARALLDRLVPGIEPQHHPRDLSEGQRLALALAVVLVSGPPVLLLDEPTRGLDYGAKAELARVLRGLADAGHTVVLATHDVEMVAVVADRAVVLADGEVVADGPAREVVTASPVFAPQVAKIMAPLPLVSVAEVSRVMGATP